MVANYRQTVLTAFSQVEDNLAAQTLLASQYETQTKALAAARKQLEVPGADTNAEEVRRALERAENRIKIAQIHNR